MRKRSRTPARRARRVSSAEQRADLGLVPRLHELQRRAACRGRRGGGTAARTGAGGRRRARPARRTASAAKRRTSASFSAGGGCGRRRASRRTATGAPTACAGEHHRGGAAVEQREGRRAAVHVAGGDHGDGQLGGEGERDARGRRGRGRAGRRARVDADGGGAGGDEAGRRAAPRLVAVAQPGADLDRDRHAAPGDGVDHGRTTRTMPAARSGSREQRRAGAGLDDLAHRAGHVEVHEVGAGRHAARPAASASTSASAPNSWKPSGCSSSPHAR